MSLRTRSGSITLTLSAVLIGIFTLGAVATFVFRAQAESSQDAFVKAQSEAVAASDALQAGIEATRLAENRFSTAAQVAQQKAVDFADARFYCDATNNAIVYDDVRWCDVSAQRLTELEGAERDLARLRTELQIAEDELPKLEADVEATLDEETSSRAAADSTRTIYSSSLIAWVVLSALCAAAALATLVFRRQVQRPGTASSDSA